ncbi:MAG TPA: phospho-N-acetylmuramoyl-pentapeptide-transferase [Spirochaetia bacterium]|nr:phospho-N-acetylmuramoyl-pentapeptide-transferase [Spirochaetia bacterium]
MIPWLGALLQPLFGPFRLLGSRVFLIGVGASLAAFLTWWLLPRLWAHLPTDQVRAHAVGAQESAGKPVGAGLIFTSLYVLISLLFVPFDVRAVEILGCVLLAMTEGFLDDRIRGGWPEYRLAVADFVVSLLGALALSQMQPVQIWLPVAKAPLMVSPWIFVPVATALIWLTINATNCTDGVDGLSGSLALIALFYLGVILYAIVGHPDVARYLQVPHSEQAVTYAMLAFPMAGCLAGYLWYNAHPSAVLMGDAGSRPIGFLLGTLVLATGNPVLILVVAGVVLANGATGLLKMSLLRFFRIGIFHHVRYPLHDHARQNLGWSNSQVLLRFVLLQAIGTPLLLLLVLKIR